MLRLDVSVISSNDLKSQIEEVSSHKALIYKRIDIPQIFAKKNRALQHEKWVFPSTQVKVRSLIPSFTVFVTDPLQRWCHFLWNNTTGLNVLMWKKAPRSVKLT